MGPQIRKQFYSCTIESVLIVFITDWYGNCSASDRKALLRIGGTAQYITKLPAIQDLYTRRCQRKALTIVKVSSHPSHRLFSLLPHGKQYRSAKSRSKRLLNSFYPQAIRLLNIQSNSYPDYLQCHIDSVLVPPLYIVSILLFHCCSLNTCYFYLLFLSLFF